VAKTSGAKTSARPRIGKAKTVDEYLAALPDDQRRTLRKLRTQIRAVAPDAIESISYGMPTYKLDGKPLVYFSAAAHHCSLYALPTDLPELKKYDTSGKGTIRFPTDEPPPASLVTKLVKARRAALKKGAGY
jgi:uncharacterized protein YdhG (YjbR/CyaY superfamily)